jgi:transposase
MTIEKGDLRMSERGDTAQNGGPLRGPNKGAARKTRAVNGVAKRGVRGPAKTVAEGRRNEQIYFERLAGRSARALAAKFDRSTRQIHDIVKACREAGIAELELNAPWRSQQFAEEHLLQLEEAQNSLREIELSAQEQNNVSSQLGALKQRLKLLSDRTKFLQETGLMSGPRSLKFDAEVAQFWAALNKACDDYDIPDAARVAIDKAMSSAPGAEQSPPPAHWLQNPQELEAAVQRERDAAAREAAEVELLRQGAERKEAERKQEQLKRHEKAQQRLAAENLKSAGRFEEIKRENAASQVRWAAAEKTAAERGLDLKAMSAEDLRRFLGSEAPLENYDT